jgi:molecular chaperone DnaK
MYQQASQTGQEQAGAGAEGADQGGGAPPDDDVVDADFEEVKEEDKK